MEMCCLYTTIFVALMNYNELLDLSKKTSLLLYIEGGFFLEFLTRVRKRKIYAFSPTATVRVFTYTGQVQNTFIF